mgnify:FL=1
MPGPSTPADTQSATGADDPTTPPASTPARDTPAVARAIAHRASNPGAVPDSPAAAEPANGNGRRDATPAWAAGGVLLLLAGAVLLARRNRGLADTTARMAYAQHQLRQRNAELQRQSEALRQLATEDALTGALSRPAFLRALRERAEAGPLSLAVFDLDHFKQINDGHGHTTGDAALRFVAGIVRECVDSHDLFGRFGGDEFLLAFCAPQLAEPHEAAERIRLAVATRATSHVPPLPGLSLSIGLAHRLPGEDLDLLFHRADAALYRAKRDGRDRVVVADADTPAQATPERHL